MASRKKILFPRSSIPGRAPTLNEIDFGEIAINTHDGKAYIKKERNGEVSIQTIGDDAVENVYYVSKSGVLGNDGRSLGSSFLTLDSAVAVLTAQQSFKFDRDLCERDLNVLMDGVRFDMAFGTNWNQVYGGIAYRRGNSAKVTNEQLAATRQAINEARIGVISVPEIGQSSTAKARANAYFEEVVDILVNGTDNADEVVFPDPNIQYDNYSNDAARLLQDNKEFIQEEIIAYTNSISPVDYAFDKEKCQRDVGLILDAVRRDLILGTDYNTITAGMAYLRANSAYVLSNQKEGTISSINYARDLILAIDGIAGVTPDVDVIDYLFRVITNHLDGTTTTYTAPSYPTTSGATYQTADRIAATTAIQTNRATIVSALTSWINTTYPDFLYDTAKCERDTGYILDGLSHDIKYGGNTAARTNADAYFVGAISQLGYGETDNTIAAYGQLKTIVNTYVTTGPEQTRVIDLLDVIIDVLTAGNTNTIAAEVEIDVTGLTTTVYDLIDTNTATIQTQTAEYAETVVTKDSSFDVAKCQRDVGLILDAVRRDLLTGTDFWTLTAGNAYLRANSAYVLSDQRNATVLAVQFARDTVKALAGVTSDATIDVLFERVIDVIDGSIIVNQFATTFPTTGTYSGSRSAQKDAIVAAIPTLISDTTTFIDVTYNSVANGGTFEYDVAKCERDIRFIIEAIIADLTYGGNSASRQAALAYFVGTQSQLGAGESTPTVAAFTDLATRIKALTNVTEDSRVDDLIAIVNDAITAGNTDSVPAEIDIDTAGYTTTEYDAIVDNTLSVQNQTTDYVKDSIDQAFLVGNFDQEKCKRDTGYIIDAIVTDLHNGTNYNSLIAGIAYQRATSNKVQNDQLTYTVQSIEYLRDQINGLGISTENQDFVTARIKEITELLQESTDYGKTDGNDIDFTGTAISTDARNAGNALQANRRSFQRQIVTWIEENYDTLEYNQDACVRDVGFLVDAVTHDILYGGQFAARISQRAYWVGTDLLGPDNNLDGAADTWQFALGSGEKIPTIAAYEQLKTVMKSVVLTPTEDARVDELLSLIISSLNDTTGAAYQNPDFTSYTFAGDALTISNSKADFQEQVVFYANSIFPAHSYDQTKCKRDVGYILDGLTYDMKYGGNSATMINANAYYSVLNNGYLDLVGQNEIYASTLAYGRLKEICGDIVRGTLIVPSTGNTLTQDNTVPHADPSNETRVEGLVEIIRGAIAAKSNAGLTPIEQITDNDRPSLINRGVVPELQTAVNSIAFGTDNRRTIINQTVANADNFGADATIRLMSGDYTVNNPIRLPPKTAIVGDNLRTSTIRPASPDSDIFWVDNGCFIKDITFRDHQNGAACVAFDERDSVSSGTFITQSPYVQNCTSITSSGIGMRIDGSKVSGLRSMVADAFTQFNADGIGVKLMNRGYAQLVSIFTISTKTSILAETGGQCSITNSNSSFGDEGLVSTGGSPALYRGNLHADYNLNDDIIRVNAITNYDSYNYSLNLGDYKRPNYNDAIKFDSDNYYYTVLNVSDEILQNWGVSGNNDEIRIDDATALNFGEDVALSKDDTTLAITKDLTAISVRTRDGFNYIENTTLSGTNPINNNFHDDSFGERIALDANGDCIVVGAKSNNYVTGSPGGTTQHGAVYVYQRDSVDETVWNEIQFIEDSVSNSPNPTQNRRLGTDLAISGDGLTLLVTNQFDSDTNFISGSISIYTRDSAQDVNGFQKIQKLLFPKGTAATNPACAISNDGGAILASWAGNTHYYYTKNQFGLYSISQNIVSQLGQNDDAVFWRVAINDDNTYAAFANPETAETFVDTATAQSSGSVFLTVDDTSKFTVGQQVYSASSLVTEYPGDGRIPSNTTIVDIPNATTLELSQATTGVWDGTEDYVFGFFPNSGGVELFQFNEGAWSLQETVYPSDARTGTGFGRDIDINNKGDIVIVGQHRILDNEVGITDGAGAYIVERAGSNWSQVAKLQPQTLQYNGDGNGSVNDDRFGRKVTVGGSGDYIVIGADSRTADGQNPSGAAFTYSSILTETGSYELTIAPPLNRNLKGGVDNTSFHQRSLITSSSHTFEYVGAGTNMFTAIPQNGGIPIKDKETIFDSADAANPNFGLVYFTATDELGDFRIGGDLTINRESGTITGTTFDRSLFAVLTPYILALEG